MDKTRHSPLPWRVDAWKDDEENLSGIEILDANLKTVMSLDWDTEKDLANANLICKAVNAHAGLVDDCKHLRKLIGQMQNESHAKKCRVLESLEGEDADLDALRKENATLNEVASNLQKSRAKIIEDNNSLRDLVRRMLPFVEEGLVHAAQDIKLYKGYEHLSAARQALSEHNEAFDLIMEAKNTLGEEHATNGNPQT